jgi:anti-sigma B factor antagonist
MKIVEQKIGNNLVLEIMEPRLVADQAQPFKEEVGRYFTNGPTSIVLNLEKVEFIDSTGLGALLSLLKRMPQGSQLLVCELNESVNNMFMLTRMDRVFTICRTVNEAVNTLMH